MLYARAMGEIERGTGMIHVSGYNGVGGYLRYIKYVYQKEQSLSKGGRINEETEEYIIYAIVPR